MNTEPEDDPGKKMRKLLGSSPPVLRLPKKIASNTSLPPKLEDEENAVAPADQQAGASEPSKPSFASTPKGKPASVSKGRLPLFDSPLWNVASVISLAVNAILLIALIVLVINLSSFGMSTSAMVDLGWTCWAACMVISKKWIAPTSQPILKSTRPSPCSLTCS